MSSTLTINQVVNQIRAFPGVIPVLGTAPSTEVALTIANDVIQKMLAQSLPWKFNRGLLTPFLTVALQQDYITSSTDLAWLEQAWRIDINNTAVPKPVAVMETVRDLPQTWQQSVPYQMSWVPNSIAIYGTWVAQTSYPTGLGQTQTPTSPIQQIIDVNGNFLFVSGNGTSGLVKPSLPANSVAGLTVLDGSVTWTVADPNGIALRMMPMPATSGIVWEIHPVYQKKPPIKTKLSDTISPIPDEFGYLFRQGFLAMCMIHAKDKSGRDEYARWEESLIIALRSGDRERDQITVYPSEGLTSGSYFGYGMPAGPANPYYPGF